MQGRLSGRVAVVTGAASGIGAAVAKRFVNEGARVCAVDRAQFDGVAVDPESIVRLTIDITETDAPQAIAQAARHAFGHVDILVNNAGICDYVEAVDCDDATWDRAIAINLTATFRLCREMGGKMKSRGWGRIINTASIMAERSYRGLAAYAASKHGVAGLTRTLAIELGSHGVTANYVLPGAILTGITRPLIDSDPALQEVYDAMGVIGRMGHPEDVSGAFAFLASEDAAFITGHGLSVDGGALLKV